MIIKHAHISKFRGLKEVDFDMGKKMTAIVGHNGTMKTTVLGILSQTFTIGKDNPMFGSKTIDGYNFHSQLKEKFKLSEKDVPGEHLWKLELYPNIYKKDFFEAHSIERDKKTLIPRFWSTEGKGKGTGYPQVPAYYISLKRVTPIGEEKRINYLAELSDEEKNFLITEYKEIFAITESNEIKIDSIVSSNKHTAAIHNKNHDALAISAGQDNLGKMLVAVLSFKRLKDKFKDNYRGGLLLIDEIESTFHPAAQKRLINRMYRYATDFKIQFVFTTHSSTVIKSTFFDKHNTDDAQLLYLKKVGEHIIGYNNPNTDNVIAELSGEVLQKKKQKRTKIEIFTEDDNARQFMTNILSSYKNNISFNSCSLGAEEYVELLRVKLEPIKNAIIILDGDKNNNSINNKLNKIKSKNVMFLPTQDCPEKMFYKFLFNLPAEDPFWNNDIGGYDKQKCFSQYTTLLERNAQTEMYKKWYEANRIYWGRGNKKLFDYWKICEKEAFEKLIEQFKQKYNRQALIMNADIID